MANNEKAPVTSKQDESSSKGKKSHVLNYCDRILKRGRNLYKASWIDRSTKVKTAALKKAITEICTLDYTEDVFMMDFAKRVSALTDNKSFCKKCEDRQLEPYNAATHIVMMAGTKGIISLVIDSNYDGDGSVFTPFAEWAEPVLPKEELKGFYKE